MCKRPATDPFASRFATVIATCLAGLMPALFVSDASAAPIDRVVIGTWESTNINATINPMALDIGE